MEQDRVRALSDTARREQGFLDDHQVGQGEQGTQLRGFFGQAAVAQLSVAELILDDMERVLDPGPHLRHRPLHRRRAIPQPFGQRLDDAALDRDVPGDIAIIEFGPFVYPGIAGISEDIRFPAVQQGRCLIDVGSWSAVPTTVCTTPERPSTPICAVIPKCH